jgi:hypothetical protein
LLSEGGKPGFFVDLLDCRNLQYMLKQTESWPTPQDQFLQLLSEPPRKGACTLTHIRSGREVLIAALIAASNRVAASFKSLQPDLSKLLLIGLIRTKLTETKHQQIGGNQSR